MPDTVHIQYSAEVREIMQRLFRLKDRFKVGVPENLIILRKRIRESNLGGKTTGITDFDLFHRVGIVFSRYQEPISMGELSHDLEVPLSTATRIMDWLVNNGYAVRLTDPGDRRIVRVALTDAGQDIYRTVNEFFMERVERFMRQFTPEERDTLLALLRKILDALEKET
jgi:DNA-binding MarR family transcriptional regulator